MGVKHFFIWLKRNFPETLTDIKKGNDFESIEVSVDNLCLDMNGIFHTSAQKIYEYGNYERKSLLRRPQYKKGLKWQLKLYEDVAETINHYFTIVKPRKRLVLCIDGIAGQAKMNQQRQRRYRSQQLQNADFDTCSITPGTKLMEHMSRYIEWYIRMMVTNHPDWQNIEIIYSNDKVPGEGEHKIINYIRHNENKGESYCIHGLDADLIMLSLATRVKNMFVLRENIRNTSELHLINIGLLGTQLANHLKWDSEEECRKKCLENIAEGSVPDADAEDVDRRHGIVTFSANTAIDDFIFMCFLVGNDFVPTIPTLAILDGGIDSMIDVYKTVGRSYGHLTRISRKSKDTTVVFQQAAMTAFLGTVAQYEAGLLEEKFNSGVNFIEDPILTSSMGPVQEIDSKFIQKIDFGAYRTKYYKKKLDIEDNETDIFNVCDQYLRGLQWVMTYYKKGMPDWKWFYPEFYAPFLCDLAACCEKSEMIAKQMPFTIHTPVEPFFQLLCVLPTHSNHLLPEPLSNLLLETSPLKKYIPDEVEVDCTGKRQEWEGIVLLPNIDVEQFRKHYDSYYKSVSEFDKRRNCTKQSLLMKYSDKLTPYNYKSFYGDIKDCSVDTKYFDI